MLEKEQSTLSELLLGIAPFSASELEQAQCLFSIRRFSAKDRLFSAGEVNKDLYFVTEGFGRYFYIDPEGHEKNKMLVRKGGLFASATSIVGGKPSPYYAQALIDCTTVSIAYPELVKLSLEHQHWNVFLRTLLERVLLGMERRKAALLMLGAKERYLEFLEEFGGDAQAISLRQVAMYVGITDVSLSRIRKELGLT